MYLINAYTLVRNQELEIFVLTNNIDLINT